jgi:hypothetical protein
VHFKVKQGLVAALSLPVPRGLVELHLHDVRQLFGCVLIQVVEPVYHVLHRVLVDVGQSLERDEVQQVCEPQEARVLLAQGA